MTNSIRLTTTKPFMALTIGEQDALLDRVNRLLASGAMVVLGGQRCFLCGSELGSYQPDRVKYYQSRSMAVRVFMRLCDSCFDAAEGRNR